MKGETPIQSSDMAEFEFPFAAQLVVNSYDPASGCYRRQEGSLTPVLQN